MNMKSLLITMMLLASVASPAAFALTGQEAADTLNKAYNNDPACGSTVGIVYCKGVTVRTVDNGSFNPWASSPNAKKLGSVSFTWLHSRLSTNVLYHPAGYVAYTTPVVGLFTTPGEKMLDMPRCIYPFDAWTTVSPRGSFGCDFEGTSSRDDYKSSCKAIGVNDAKSWIRNYQEKGQVSSRQCSVPVQGSWEEVIGAHEGFSTLKNRWTEVLVKTPTDENMRLTVGAFFYDQARSGGLIDAQAFQRKMASTGRRLPIVKLDFSVPAANRFSYQQSDQVAFP